MYTYSELKAKWDSRLKSNNYKPLGNNTRLEMRGDVFQVIFHSTAIVKIYPCDKVTINPGGWADSPTTRSRIQEYGGVYIYSDNRTNGLQTTTRIKGRRMPHDLPYTDGLEFRNGLCLNPEICIDNIVTLKRSAVGQVTAKLKTLRALMLTMAKLNAFDKNCRTPLSRTFVPPAHLLKEPTVEMASALYLHEHRDGCPGDVTVGVVMNWLRKNLYDAMDAYDSKEIRYDCGQQTTA